MTARTYRFADTDFEIKSLYSRFHELCRDYQSENRSQFYIETSQEDLVRERTCQEKAMGAIAARIPEEELERVNILRKVAYYLADQNVLTFHSSAVAVDGKGYLFSATSGTGKSTHARLWRDLFGERLTVINDDRPFLRVSDHEILAYGSPWNGKHHLSTNCHVPVHGIAVLKRGDENSIRRMDHQEAWSKLIQQTVRPDNPEGTLRIVRLLDRMMDRVPIWELTCNMDPEAARVAFDAMSRE